MDGWKIFVFVCRAGRNGEVVVEVGRVGGELEGKVLRGVGFFVVDGRLLLEGVRSSGYGWDVVVGASKRVA
jgi:hypothetical protein